MRNLLLPKKDNSEREDEGKETHSLLSSFGD